MEKQVGWIGRETWKSGQRERYGRSSYMTKLTKMLIIWSQFICFSIYFPYIVSGQIHNTKSISRRGLRLGCRTFICEFIYKWIYQVQDIWNWHKSPHGVMDELIRRSNVAKWSNITATSQNRLIEFLQIFTPYESL